MRLKKELILDIFVSSEEELNNIKAGIFDEEDDQAGFEKVEPRIFYVVDSVYPYKDSSGTYADRTAIVVSGQIYVAKIGIEQIRSKIFACV